MQSSFFNNSKDFSYGVSDFEVSLWEKALYSTRCVNVGHIRRRGLYLGKIPVPGIGRPKDVNISPYELNKAPNPDRLQLLYSKRVCQTQGLEHRLEIPSLYGAYLHRPKSLFEKTKPQIVLLWYM
jgi:hypothetical protein